MRFCHTSVPVDDICAFGVVFTRDMISARRLGSSLLCVFVIQARTCEINISALRMDRLYVNYTSTRGLARFGLPKFRFISINNFKLHKNKCSNVTGV